MKNTTLILVVLVVTGVVLSPMFVANGSYHRQYIKVKNLVEIMSETDKRETNRPQKVLLPPSAQKE